MLFSKDNVARFVQMNFEPVWVKVREVPMLKLDFGNGNVITRTLHGNIATYACTANGTVLDILPGIYEPKKYIQQLSQLRMLARYVAQAEKGKGAERLKEYHVAFANALENDKGERPFLFDRADFGKSRIERNSKVMLLKMTIPKNAVPVAKTEQPKVDRSDLATWTALAKDTEVNETERRLMIHKKLAEVGTVAPGSITKWLYKDVLHADLDDPYLGLGKYLFDNYVFEEEDRR